MFKLKAVIVGDAAAGKSALLNRYTTGRFDDTYTCTVGVDFASRVIRDGQVQLQIWDTAGLEMYRSLTRAYFRDIGVLLVCYDTNNRASFDHAESHWHSATTTMKHIPTALVGLKKDKPRSAVSSDEGRQLAHRLNAQFYECSSKTGEGVEAIFEGLVDAVTFPSPPPSPSPSSSSSSYPSSSRHLVVRDCCVLA